MVKRWCFLCENPIGSQRSGWLWFHEECARRVLDNSGDLLWIMEQIKKGKFTKLQDITDYLNKAKEFDDKMDTTARYFNSLRKNENMGIRPVL